MACNCATSEQINELYKKYGDKRIQENKRWQQKVKSAAMQVGVVLAMIPITPFLFIYVFYKAFCDEDHRISLTKFFRLDKKVGYAGKQNIQD